MQLLDKLACCKKESVDGDKGLCLLAVFLEAHTQSLSYHISHISRWFELQYFEGCDNEKCDQPCLHMLVQSAFCRIYVLSGLQFAPLIYSQFWELYDSYF